MTSSSHFPSDNVPHHSIPGKTAHHAPYETMMQWISQQHRNIVPPSFSTTTYQWQPPAYSDAPAWVTRTHITAPSESVSSSTLHHTTVAVKDTVHIQGVPTGVGTNVWGELPAASTATIIHRVLSAGATITGKTACEYMCVSGSSHTASSGVLSHPENDEVVTGGSSSGSAWVVAREEVDMAIGGDQGGSIRIPAALCGIVGVKPTFSLVPYTGVVGLNDHVDHVGPMSRTVAQSILLLAAIAGPDGLDPRQTGGANPHLYTVPTLSTAEHRDYHYQHPELSQYIPMNSSLQSQGISGHSFSIHHHDAQNDPYVQCCHQLQSLSLSPSTPWSLPIRVGILQEGFGTQHSDPAVDDTIMNFIRKHHIDHGFIHDSWRAYERNIRRVLYFYGAYQTLWADCSRLKSTPYLSPHLAGSASNMSSSVLFPPSPKGETKNFREADSERIRLWHEKVTQFPEQIHPYVWELIKPGKHIAQSQPWIYQQALDLIPHLQHKINTQLEHYDVIVMPTVPFTAPQLSQVIGKKYGELPAFAYNTGMFNVSGHPAVTIPIGRVKGLPVGLMIVGRHYEDAKLLQIARTFETLAHYNS